MEVNLKKSKFFGDQAQRVTTKEMHLIFKEISSLLSGIKLELVRPIAQKEDHGDIDILTIHPIEGFIDKLKYLLGDKILKINNNNYMKSVLFRSVIGKTVHVDFILSDNEIENRTKSQYFQLNDFSFAIGVVAKNLGFKYSLDGFYKTYVKNIYHYILLTKNLNQGLEIIGYRSSDVDKIKSYDDIIRFVISSPLFDSSFFDSGDFDRKDRQSIRARRGADYIASEIRSLNIKRKTEDNDYFLKNRFPELYEKYLQEVKKIDEYVYIKPKYNGFWLMKVFGVLAGKQIGIILNDIRNNFKDLENMPEDQVVAYIKDNYKL